MRLALAAASLIVLSACGLNGTDGDGADSEATAAPTAPADDNLADSMASRDPAPGERVVPEIPDVEERPLMQVQVVLDRQGFGPGVIDGAMGMSTENALRGFQEANELEATGELDESTRQALAQWDNIAATRVVRIPEAWGKLTFAPVPDDPAEQAEMERLGYETLAEKLAERFHTTVEVLETLNPGGKPAGMTGAAEKSATTGAAGRGGEGERQAKFTAGQLVRVPNIGADRIAPGAIENPDWQRTLQMLGVGSEQPEVSRIVVSKSKGTLRAYDGEDNLVALFTVTSGSEHDPLPLGEWGVNGVAFNPPFAYDPSLFWDVPDHEEEQQIPPGPNNPVGVVWIDLTKEHYGIHGTPEPQTIGRTQSHGCVRLTNWDAARLAEMVTGSTKVLFEA
ncbi:L,D-transpeptidase family protein [Pelagerythrobacter rhizovicinus]|uniref:Murein L,D-transpeptidase n=1 Tax=Pelagerythrobacter rhizovicinus TaxID=2268576 RepID=A0A4Q2KLT1_9SPHN|nr:L,D-transpeptidase family protein [Pelagerythrobacter rhizovicinus]RXZ66274.1 murein L,D-transpeptidase [Pelagerythrobacter rhizovicinus]